MIEVIDDLFDYKFVWDTYQYFENYQHWEKLGYAFGSKVPSLGRVFDKEFGEFAPIANKYVKILYRQHFKISIYNAFTYKAIITKSDKNIALAGCPLPIRSSTFAR